MADIYAIMFGRFDILIDGDSVLTSLGNSWKSILLLKYLLLNGHKPITTADLIDIFWSEPDKSANPENALKTMVSRIRLSLSNVSPSLKNCILSENRSYRWNPEIPYQSDVFLFEEMVRDIQSNSRFNQDTREKYIKILELYRGDLSCATADENWIISRSMYLHHLYLQTVYRFIELLKAEEDYKTVVYVCRIALDVDTFDELLNLELMNALKVGGQNSAALFQYNHITNAYYKYLGIEPSDKILSFYKGLIKTDLEAETDINSIRLALKQADDEDDGAFICDYSIFRDVYMLQLRNLTRQKNKMFLSLLTVSQTLDDGVEHLVFDSVMRELRDILKQCLRKGDTLTRYSASQYAILLPMANDTSSSMVINRIRKVFYNKYLNGGLKLHFQFESLDQI